MACTSGSVQKVADKTVEAANQIKRLQDMIAQQDSAIKAKFMEEINKHLADANVKDAREIGYSSDIKTEYTSEFSLDKIAAVVTKALEAVGKAQDPKAKQPALSPEAIQSYVDVVNTVAEAAKSSSTAAASLSFSMNRLSPGLFAFLYATSVNIKDEDTFGSEAVTTTAIYYQFIESIDDVKNETEFGLTLLDAKTLLDMKTLQVALVDQLASGDLSIEEWSRKDDLYAMAVKKLEDRLAAHQFDKAKTFSLPRQAGFGKPIQHSFAKGSVENQKLVRTAIETLCTKGEAYKVVVERSEARLASAYY